MNLMSLDLIQILCIFTNMIFAFSAMCTNKQSMLKCQVFESLLGSALCCTMHQNFVAMILAICAIRNVSLLTLSPNVQRRVVSCLIVLVSIIGLTDLRLTALVVAFIIQSGVYCIHDDMQVIRLGMLGTAIISLPYWRLVSQLKSGYILMLVVITIIYCWEYVYQKYLKIKEFAD